MTNAEVRLRPASPADAEAVTGLVNEREFVDRGVIEATVAYERGARSQRKGMYVERDTPSGLDW